MKAFVMPPSAIGHLFCRVFCIWSPVIGRDFESFWHSLPLGVAEELLGSNDCSGIEVLLSRTRLMH